MKIEHQCVLLILICNQFYYICDLYGATFAGEFRLIRRYLSRYATVLVIVYEMIGNSFVSLSRAGLRRAGATEVGQELCRALNRCGY